MRPKSLFLLRHGQTEYNRLKIVQGSGVDAGLNETGKAQARAFHRAYQREPFDLVMTSALRRTHETIAPFLAAGLPWEQHAELNEIGWGRHEGKKSTPAMIEEYHQVLSCWKRGDLRACLADGESAAEMAARLIRFVERLKARPERRILLCSHGRSMRALLCILLGKPLAGMDDYQHGNTALYVLRGEADGRFQLERFNDRAHLQGQQGTATFSKPPSQSRP